MLAAVLALAPRGTLSRAWCIPLVAVGGNLHAGAVFAAFVLGLECLEAFWRTRRPAELALAALGGLALLANPGILFDARYLLHHLLEVNPHPAERQLQSRRQTGVVTLLKAIDGRPDAVILLVTSEGRRVHTLLFFDSWYSNNPPARRMWYDFNHTSD